MNFPAGTDGGTITNPQDERFIQDLMAFRGAIEITTATGHGFILTDNGRLISAYFRDEGGIFRGKDALSHMTLDPGSAESPQTFSLHTYNQEELTRAVQISREETCSLMQPLQHPLRLLQPPNLRNPPLLFPRISWMRPNSRRSSPSPGSLLYLPSLKGSRCSLSGMRTLSMLQHRPKILPGREKRLPRR